jgi:hypothetical protein
MWQRPALPGAQQQQQDPLALHFILDGSIQDVGRNLAPRCSQGAATVAEPLAPVRSRGQQLGRQSALKVRCLPGGDAQQLQAFVPHNECALLCACSHGLLAGPAGLGLLMAMRTPE